MSLANAINFALSNKRKLNIKLDVPPEQAKFFIFLKQILAEFQNVCTFYPAGAQIREDYVISTSAATLKSITGDRGANINDYAGSIIKGNLFLYPCDRYAAGAEDVKFCVRRWITKLVSPEKFYTAGQFTWGLIGYDATLEEAESFLSGCILQAWDIENSGRQDFIPSINGIAGITESGEVRSYVFPFTEYENIKCLQRLAASDVPKVTQNGTYDLTYYFRFNMPLRNWMFDTFHMMHAWYAELPRDLGFITSLLIRDISYWKDEINGGYLDYCRYNARDVFGTLHACIAILKEWPDWAVNNYRIQFPIQIPLIKMGMHGLRVDEELRKKLGDERQEEADKALARLRHILGDPDFNPASPPQVTKVIQTLGCPDIEGSGKIEMEQFAYRHPLNAIIADEIRNYRGALKAKSNYFDVHTYGGRIYYKFIAAGTESGRLAGKASDFAFNSRLGEEVKPVWEHIGFQIQNVPPYAKRMLLADEGFLIYEADKEQAETRATAYLAQEENLIKRVEFEPDFHCANVTAFFGIPFNEVYNPEGKTKDDKVLLPEIRQLTKKLNHGASYNMAWQVLLATMGEKNVWKAKALLKLPASWGLKEVTQYLIDRFCAAVPRLKGVRYSKTSHAKGANFLILDNTYYGDIILEVERTNKLVSPLGWTRYCFGNPRKNKPDLNAYVAHPSQNLSVADVNEGILRMYNDPRLQDFSEFRLSGQVHDSCLFQIKIGNEDKYLPIVKELFAQPIMVHGREMLIPVDVSKGKASWK